MLTDLEPLLVPIVTLVLGIAGKGIFDLIVQAKGGRAAKMPTVEAIWKRMDQLDAKLEAERQGRLSLLRVFRSYVERVQRGGSSDLTIDERAALDETDNHQEAPR